MSVTIYDIAERARVSIATVSRVLNGNARVSEATRLRVAEIAEELGYEPHASAQSLARRTTRLISAVVPMMTSYFFMEVLRGVQDRLDESDYDLVVYASRSLDRIDGQLGRAVQRGRADGLLLLSTPLTPSRAERLAESSRPTVLVDAYHDEFDSVSVDNRRGGAEAARALLEGGHEDIGLILPVASSVPAAERRAGFEAALELAGRSLNPTFVLETTWDVGQDGYTRRAGYLSMQELLNRARRPTAVFVAADVMAFGVLRALREAGLHVPEDVAVVGFDDIASSAYVGLTTLRQPMYEMGKLATEKLLRRLCAPELPPSHTVFAPHLVVRETTNAVRTNAVSTNAVSTNAVSTNASIHSDSATTTP